MLALRLHLLEKRKRQVSFEEARTQKHLKGCQAAVDLDWFAQFVIDNYIYIQDDKEQQLRDLF